MVGLVLCLMAMLATSPAIADLQESEHCESQALPFLDCVSAGLRWVIVGGPGDDILRGTPFDDVIHSGRGGDRVYGGRGEDVCWVQPADVVRGCEVRRS